jgi:hypothetical protein
MEFFYLFGCREMITQREYMSHSLRKVLSKSAVSNYSKQRDADMPQMSAYDPKRTLDFGANH